jgi:hypothetical protein
MMDEMLQKKNKVTFNHPARLVCRSLRAQWSAMQERLFKMHPMIIQIDIDFLKFTD